ncbi:MAG: cytidine deaminase [Planctomycetota bacterium]|nr:cytidine deaminase [Planctomycetota bacterium]
MKDLAALALQELAAAAVAVQAHAYAPASHFAVGAAVLADDGRVFAGCNVENASYGLTICAERAAVFAAVAAGCKALRAVAIATDLRKPARPCGACRQVLAEFGPDMVVVLVGTGGVQERTTLGALLPEPFTFADLARARGGKGAPG